LDTGWTTDLTKEVRATERLAQDKSAKMLADGQTHLPGGWWILPGVALGIVIWTVIFFTLIRPIFVAIFGL